MSSVEPACSCKSARSCKQVGSCKTADASNGWCGTRSVAGGVFDKINPRVVVNGRLKTLITILLN